MDLLDPHNHKLAFVMHRSPGGTVVWSGSESPSERMHIRIRMGGMKDKNLVTVASEATHMAQSK